MKRVAYLGNIWEYPEALGRIPGVRVAAVLYENDRPADLTGNDTESALRVARQTGAQVFRVATDHDVRLALESVKPLDCGIMANFGIILSAEALSLPKDGIVNFHPGILPDQAGRTPVVRLWNAGGGASGLTIHRAIARPDAGPVLKTLPAHVDKRLTLEENILALYRLGLSRLPDVLFPPQKPAI